MRDGRAVGSGDEFASIGQHLDRYIERAAKPLGGLNRLFCVCPCANDSVAASAMVSNVAWRAKDMALLSPHPSIAVRGPEARASGTCRAAAPSSATRGSYKPAGTGGKFVVHSHRRTN